MGKLKLKTKTSKKCLHTVSFSIKINLFVSYQLILVFPFHFFLFRTFISSWRDHHHPHGSDLVVHPDYTPFRFADPHHHYDLTPSYYNDTGVDPYGSSSTAAAAAASVYSPYMVRHHSPPPTNSNSPSIKPETAVTAAALQSALSLSTPMNVNVSMNFNSHNIQYANGYNMPTASVNLSYEPFYASNRYQTPPPYHHHYHHSSIPSKIKNRFDSTMTKSTMFLSSTGNYDYKDLSKLYGFFPTSASSTGSNEKRKYIIFYLCFKKLAFGNNAINFRIQRS